MALSQVIFVIKSTSFDVIETCLLLLFHRVLCVSASRSRDWHRKHRDLAPSDLIATLAIGSLGREVLHARSSSFAARIASSRRVRAAGCGNEPSRAHTY